MNRLTLVRSRNYGDFTVRLEYVNPNPREIGSEHEPALLLCRPPKSGVKSACVIMMNAAHQYVTDGNSGQPSLYALKQAVTFCNVLGLYPDKSTVFKLVTAIIDNLDDLYQMPPYETPTKVVGEATIHVGSQKISTELRH